MRIERYTTAIADEVAELIETSFAEYRRERPAQLLGAPAPWTTREELLQTLTSDELCAQASHVAVEGGRVVSAALAVQGGDDCGWWRVATAPEHRRQGFASACMAAGESAMREAGQASAATSLDVDSRWESAQALLVGAGYEAEDADKRNITMVAERWEPQPVELHEGYELGTLREEDLPEWMAVRNTVFKGEQQVEWFEQRFMSRADFDPTTWFVVRHEGRMIGIASAVCVEDERDPQGLRGGQIEWVGVLDDHRGKRLGEDLVVTCLNAIAERGFLPALLLTQPFRVPAVTLYEKLGFATISAWQRWEKPLG